jgi:hypothetical protein
MWDQAARAEAFRALHMGGRPLRVSLAAWPFEFVRSRFRAAVGTFAERRDPSIFLNLKESA